MIHEKAKLLGVGVLLYCLWELQNFLGALEFDRQKILFGEVWRIWTGHLVHTNSYHFSLNIAAAIIIYSTFLTKMKLGELLMYSFVFVTLISVTLLCTYPSLSWYNGLSGLLHALVAYSCIRLAIDGDNIFWAGLAIVWGKVLIEAVRTHSGHENLIGDMTVITEAHLIGTFFGTATAIICMAHLRGKENSESNKIETQ